MRFPSKTVLAAGKTVFAAAKTVLAAAKTSPFQYPPPLQPIGRPISQDAHLAVLGLPE